MGVHLIGVVCLELNNMWAIELADVNRIKSIL